MYISMYLDNSLHQLHVWKLLNEKQVTKSASESKSHFCFVCTNAQFPNAKQYELVMSAFI